MAKYADVIINISVSALDRSFQYLVPEELEDQIVPGVKVDVPFSSNFRIINGYVIGVTDKPKVGPEKIKPIKGISPRGVDVSDRMIALAVWMKERYGCTMNQALTTVLPAKRVTRKGKTKIPSAAVKDALALREPVKLNEDQEKARDAILREMAEENRPNLLFGVTGSGKTEVYMAVMEEVLAAGKQVILLIPEIALTYQNLRRFYERFGDRIGVIHSRQSAGEKYETIAKAQRGELDLVIGPRSALFAPFPDLGLIIIDEEHEESYRSETSPRYHSVEVAGQLSRMCGAGLILGSATPSLESFYQARQGKYQLIRLPHRAVSSSRLAQTSVIDLREELAAGNRSIFSRLLKEKIGQRLADKEQIMLFINRRGYAGFVSCRSCGLPLICPHCDVSLTYHTDGRLRCHYCGYSRPFPHACPSCGSPYIAAFGTGTQKVESLIRKEFPNARVLRMDADTTRGKEGHSRILSAFSNQEADILLGTQMIVKGHDFPRVSLVGVLAADISLYTEDYRAAERSFSLLTQAVGRAGRGELPGEAIIQTYKPEHYAVRTASAQDYEAFYEEEMARRTLLHYPPAGGMLLVTVTGLEEEETARAAAELARTVKHRFAGDVPDVIGPAVQTHGKLQDIYRQVFYVKLLDRSRLLAIQRFLMEKVGERISTDLY